MPAERLDIILETNADFEWNFRLETNACSIIDLAGYGAKLQIRNELEGELILEASHNTYINVNATLDQVEVDIPQSAIVNVLESFRTYKWRGVWDLVLFPGSNTETADPVALVYGNVKYRRGATELS